MTSLRCQLVASSGLQTTGIRDVSLVPGLSVPSHPHPLIHFERSTSCSTPFDSHLPDCLCPFVRAWAADYLSQANDSAGVSARRAGLAPGATTAQRNLDR